MTRTWGNTVGSCLVVIRYIPAHYPNPDKVLITYRVHVYHTLALGTWYCDEMKQDYKKRPANIRSKFYSSTPRKPLQPLTDLTCCI